MLRQVKQSYLKLRRIYVNSATFRVNVTHCQDIIYAQF